MKTKHITKASPTRQMASGSVVIPLFKAVSTYCLITTLPLFERYDFVGFSFEFSRKVGQQVLFLPTSISNNLKPLRYNLEKRSKTHSTEHSKDESWLPNVKPPHSPCNCLAAHQFTLSYDTVLRPLGPKWTVQFKSLQGIAECLAARTLTMTNSKGLSESHTRNRRI